MASTDSIFALAYVAIQVGRTTYTSWAKGEWQRRGSKNMIKATVYFVASAVPWIIGGLESDPQLRLAWWSAALIVEYSGPQFFFFVPGFGRSTIEGMGHQRRAYGRALLAVHHHLARRGHIGHRRDVRRP